MFPDTTQRHHPPDTWDSDDFDHVTDDETVEPLRHLDEQTTGLDLDLSIPHHTARASRRRQSSRRNRAWRRRLGRR